MNQSRHEQRRAIMREASERIHDPGKIDDLLGDLDPDQRTTLWKLYRSSRSQLTGNEAKLKSALLRDFQTTARAINSDMAETFSNIGGGPWDLTTVKRMGRDQVLFAQLKDRITALGGQITDTTANGLLGQYKQAYADSAYRMDVLTPASVRINFGAVPDMEIVSMLSKPWSGANFSERLGIMTDEMANNVKHSLIRSMMAQESWQEAARRIRAEMGTAGQRSVWRAEMIARTELAHAQEMATEHFNAVNADVIDDEIWVASPGACAAICLEKHGQSVSEVGRPPDDSHPNCTCDVMAVPKAWSGLADEGADFNPRVPSRASWVEQNIPSMSDT